MAAQTTKLKENNMNTKSPLKSKTVWASAITSIGGVIALLHEPAGQWLQTNVAELLIVLGFVFAILRKLTGAPLTWLPLALAMCTLSLPSCAPASYVVDVRTYQSAIEDDPSYVIMSPKHVTAFGGFQADFSAKILTDQGEIDLSPDGVSGTVVIDQRSGK